MRNHMKCANTRFESDDASTRDSACFFAEGEKFRAFTTALYLRLSVDDDNCDESDSIANQRELLNNYVAINPILSSGEVLSFADDGWSGTNFDRPQVKELLTLAKRGDIQCIVVKDLSRWGRNYPEVSEYLDQIFPFLGIRFISLGEDYDSDNYKGQTAPMDIAFGTIMSDVYCRDLSVKVRQSYVTKTKSGEFLCGSPPFGFVKSSDGKNRLVIDDEAAVTIRRIFALACDGNSNTQIAVLLNNDGIDTPLMYRKRKGRTLRGANFVAGNRVFWTSESVRKILVDERYTGVMVSGKQRVATPGSRKREYIPESQWIRVPGSHDAIVSEDVFKQAKAGMHHCKIISPIKKRSLFSGKIKCGHCGRSMEYMPSKNPYYRCGALKYSSGIDCFDGRLHLNKLSDIVLATVKVEAQKVLDDLQQKKQRTNSTESKNALNSELSKLSARTALLTRRGIALFEEFADCKIDKDSYIEAVVANDEELHKIQIRIEELKNQLNAMKNKLTADGKESESILRYVINTDMVTGEVLSLIDRIVIYSDERIEIRLAFDDSN